MKSALLTAAAALLAGGLLACDGPVERPADGLGAATIPSDFTFATSRAVRVRAQGSAAVLATTMAEIRGADGDLVHRGPLTGAVQLVLPTAVDSVQVTLRSSDGERVQTVAVVDGEAVVNVE